MIDDYDSLAVAYSKSHDKPDKKYSMGPTMMSLLSPLEGKVILDIACGDGFFTRQLAARAARVYGIDNSPEQIKRACATGGANIEYILGDMRTTQLPACDGICMPFVFNCLETRAEMAALFKKFHHALSKGGMMVGIVDMPRWPVHDNKKFGAVKRIPSGVLAEGAPMDIELYNGDAHITTLHGVYHTRKALSFALHEAGFTPVIWHPPQVSAEGLRVMGRDFWEEYLARSDVEYVHVMK